MGFQFKSDQDPQPTEVAVVEENLEQDIFAEGEEERLAIQFLEENGLYTKFLLYCGIQEQLKKLKDSLATEE